ncbi:MAG: hypothetical protein CBE00_00055 [Planctomycetaceae bacterium TMED240]|nr:hypothetical protein [Rhodopirellula sp.]OUX09102.1 MAG: hypothetical protein CBE00_00055 [Planctomycetaceae bacterium TMED240]
MAGLLEDTMEVSAGRQCNQNPNADTKKGRVAKVQLCPDLIQLIAQQHGLLTRPSERSSP